MKWKKPTKKTYLIDYVSVTDFSRTKTVSELGLGFVGEIAISHFVRSKTAPKEEIEEKNEPPEVKAKRNIEKRLQEEAAKRNGELAANILKIFWGVASLFFSASHSRHCETEADAVGMKYAAKAGYGLDGMARVQTVLAELNQGHEGGFLSGWLSTHPQSKDRMTDCHIIKQMLEEKKDNGFELELHDLEAQLKNRRPIPV